MKKRMLTLLVVAAVLCGGACGRKEPQFIEREAPKTALPKESETQTTAKDPLPVYDPERIAAASKWDGNQQMVTRHTEIYEFRDGNGKKESPYLLKSAEDVARLAANVRFYGNFSMTDPSKTRYRGVYFRLECDIDMQGYPWWGIGGGSELSKGNTSFDGFFDGNGHAIYNLALREEAMSGFFSFLGDGAVVKDLVIASGTVKTTSKYRYAGILAGFAEKGAVIENCSVCVEMTEVRPEPWTVGIIGGAGNPAKLNKECDFSGVTRGGEPYAVAEIGYARSGKSD